MTDKEKFDLQLKVMNRADKLGLITPDYERITLACDLGYAKSKCGKKLNLKKLMSFDDGSFVHDICGLRDNLDRSENLGSLKNLFSPRCGWTDEEE